MENNLLYFKLYLSMFKFKNVFHFTKLCIIFTYTCYSYVYLIHPQVENCWSTACSFIESSFYWMMQREHRKLLWCFSVSLSFFLEFSITVLRTYCLSKKMKQRKRENNETDYYCLFNKWRMKNIVIVQIVISNYYYYYIITIIIIFFLRFSEKISSLIRLLLLNKVNK